MKKVLVLVVLCVMCAGLWAQEALPRLAVVAFSTNIGGEKIKADAVTVRNLVESQMVATRKYRIITREEIDKLLENQKIQVSSISSTENIRKLQLQNINYIVTGSVDALGGDYAVTVKVLDVRACLISCLPPGAQGIEAEILLAQPKDWSEKPGLRRFTPQMRPNSEL